MPSRLVKGVTLRGVGPNLGDLRGLLARAAMLPTTPVDYDLAASLYRTCRARGESVRMLIDCLIAAVAIRAGAEVLHADGDFAVLARHTDLVSTPPPAPDQRRGCSGSSNSCAELCTKMDPWRPKTSRARRTARPTAAAGGCCSTPSR